MATTSSPDVVATLYEAGGAWGLPASLLTDNGCIFTATHRGGYSAVEFELFSLGIAARHSSPYHPQTHHAVTERLGMMKTFQRHPSSLFIVCHWLPSLPAS